MKRISKGAPAKFTPHKGSWGDRYLIEYPDGSKRMSCARCANYNPDDKSCVALPIYVPENGYGYWKYCKHFEIEILSPIESQRILTEENISESEERKMQNTDMDEMNRDIQFKKIPQKCFETDVFWANIFLIALSKSLNIKDIFQNIESLMADDEKVNKEDWGISSMPNIEKSMIALNILASKLNCQVGAFFNKKISDRRKMAYKVISCLNPTDFYYNPTELNIDGRSYWCDLILERGYLSENTLQIVVRKEGDTYYLEFEQIGGFVKNLYKQQDFYFYAGCILYTELRGELKNFYSDLSELASEYSEDSFIET